MFLFDSMLVGLFVCCGDLVVLWVVLWIGLGGLGVFAELMGFPVDVFTCIKLVTFVVLHDVGFRGIVVLY